MKPQDALDAALDRLVAGEPFEASREVASLVEVARAARAGLAVEVPPDLAARHLARFAQTERTVVPMRRSRRSRILATGLAAAIAFGLLGGTAVAASQSAVPGDALYPVKRAAERLSIALHRDHRSRARLHLEFADERLDELQTLLERRRNGEDVDVGAAMRAYGAQLAAGEADAEVAALGGDEDELLAHVRGQLEKHVLRLRELLGTKTNPKAQEAILRAIANAEKAKDRVLHGRTTRDEGPGHGKPEGVGPESAPGRTK